MTDIDLLLYADDLAMLANSREELHWLHLYCKDRNLHVPMGTLNIRVLVYYNTYITSTHIL